MRSTTRLAIAFAAAAVVAGLPASAPAQSLGELSKLEAARRANVKKPAQAITDKDIKPAAPAAPAEPASASTTEPAAASTAPAVGAPPAGEGGEAVPEPMKARDKRDEPYWRKRFTETREAVARAQQDAADMQARVAAIDEQMKDSKLPAARRSELNVERDGALLALKRFKQNATDLGGELANLEKRAQEAKIDPAWTK